MFEALLCFLFLLTDMITTSAFVQPLCLLIRFDPECECGGNDDDDDDDVIGSAAPCTYMRSRGFSVQALVQTKTKLGGCFVSRGRCQVTLKSLTRYPWARCWTPNIHILPWDELETHPGVDPAGIGSDTLPQRDFITLYYFFARKKELTLLSHNSLFHLTKWMRLVVIFAKIGSVLSLLVQNHKLVWINLCQSPDKTSPCAAKDLLKLDKEKQIPFQSPSSLLLMESLYS